MKNILLSIDFSVQGYNAALYAAELARHTQTRLILFHVFSPIAQDNEPAIAEVEAIEVEKPVCFERKIQERLDLLSARLQALTGVSVTRLLKPGNVVDETLYVAQKIKADLILIGLTATQEVPDFHIIRSKTSLPVLFVPPRAVFKVYKSVYIAAENAKDAYGMGNLKFLNKLFYKFGSVQYQSPDTQTEVQYTDDNSGQESSDRLAENRIEGKTATTVTPADVQLLIRICNPTAVDMEDRFVKADIDTQQVPVLLLPVTAA